MSSNRDKGLTFLTNLEKTEKVLTFPYGAYLDYADFKKTTVNTKLVKLVEKVYFGLVPTPEEFLEDLKNTYGWNSYTSIEDALEDYEVFNNRYYKKVEETEI